MKLTNHYETLNVALTASPEEIRASYINLCKLFHPDLNPNKEECLMMIGELTKSYDVLKNAELRQEYDLQMIAGLKNRSVRKEVAVEKIPEVPAVPQQTENQINFEEVLAFKMRQRESLKNQDGLSSKIASAIAAIAILGTLALGLSSPSKVMSRITFMNLNEIFNTSSYVRSTIAPNGQAYPEKTSYISGYQVANNTGSSSVYINNSKNDNDVYLKLLALDGARITAVRHVLIKGKTDFKIENLTAGKYEIQYMDLVAGLAGRSEMFTVSETKTETGTTASRMSVTLKGAADGVLKVENVSADTFNSLASL